MPTLPTSIRHILYAGAVVWTVAILLGLTAIGTASVLGYGIDVVATGSMEPAVSTGSLAVVRPADAETIEVGNVIRFVNHADKPVLHRVIEVIEHNGVRRFRTKGDANPAADTQLIHESRVSGELTVTVPAVATIASLPSALKFAVLVLAVLPLAIVSFGRRPSKPAALPALAPAWLGAR